MSPSHTVGLEPAKFDEPIYFDLETESPSHAVGLELVGELIGGGDEISHHPTRWA